MKPVLLFGLILPLTACAEDKTKSADAAPKAAAKAPDRKPPSPLTVTFLIGGIRDDKCVEAVNAAVKKVESVTDVTGLSVKTGYTAVGFDQHAVTLHQIAQAITDAGAALGRPYQVSTKIRVPEYNDGDNAGKIDAIFAKHAAFVKIEPLDKAEGVFVIRFLPLKYDSAKGGRQGFNAGWLRHPINDTPPKGLGLKLIHLHEPLPADK